VVEIIQRGETWVVNFNPNKGKQIGKIRPVVVLQVDDLTAIGFGTILAAPLTTQLWPRLEPLRVKIEPRDRLLKLCYVMVEQTRALDRSRFTDGPLTTLTMEEMAAVEQSLKAVLGLL
jgi:mRNA interferase MazF